MPEDLSPDEKAERLALHATDRAAELARLEANHAASLAHASADAATKLAVERAVRDALVDRELHDHAAHLKQINHSQEEMAASLGALVTLFEKQGAVTDALDKFVRGRTNSGLSRWHIVLGVAMMVAAYGTILATILIHLP